MIQEAVGRASIHIRDALRRFAEENLNSDRVHARIKTVKLERRDEKGAVIETRIVDVHD